MAEIQQVGSNRKRQASRTRPAPEKLGRLIDLVNCLPPEPEKWERQLAQAYYKVYRPGEFWREHGEWIEALPESLREFAKEKKMGFEFEQEPVFRLLRACTIHHVLRGLARMNAGDKVVPLSVSMYVSVGKDGRVETSGDDVFQALREAEVRRIKECPICAKIFWAGRRDQPCCSKRCAGTRRTRIWRERYPETYKLRRIENEDGPIQR